MVNFRPNTLNKLRQKQHIIRTSPLHISIARMSYLKERTLKIEEEEKPFYNIIKRDGVKKE